MCIWPFKKPSEYAPQFTKTFTGQEVAAIINAKLPGVDLFLSDDIYHTCSKDALIAELGLADAHTLKYLANDFDCDDFSYRLMGDMSYPPWSVLPFGIVWTSVHALNCFIDDQGVFYFVEPQTNKISQELEGWQGTTVRFVLM